MLGWRTSMEDAHIATLEFNNDPDFHLFAVFDGHGGLNRISVIDLQAKKLQIIVN